MAFFKVISFLMGSMIGSFLNVAIYRIPREISLIKTKRSHCPGCDKQILWYENIPILSFLFLKGKCSQCDFKIPKRYLFLEIFMGVSFYLLFPDHLTNESLIIFFGKAIVLSCFVAHFFIDIDFQILPDSINILLAIMLGAGGLYYFGWLHTLLGGLVGFLLPLGVSWGFYKIKGQVGMGGGDIKLFGALGLYLGIAGIFQNLFVSCLIGSLVGIAMILFYKHKKEIPFAFGPAIILSSIFQIYFPDYFKLVMSFFFGRY